MSTKSATIQYWQFKLPKHGESAADCEDAAAAEPVRRRFAIADGASGSSYSGLWARMLVDEFVRTTRPWYSWLPEIQVRWASAVASRINGKPAPWFVESRLDQGAFSTFLGLVIEEPTWKGKKIRRWRVRAIGDSCLFQVRQNRLVKALPLARSSDFGNTPWLVGSRVLNDRSLGQKAALHKGEWRPDDRIWLTTDALAQWFLQECEAGRRPWQSFDSVLTAAAPERAFAACIEELRARNDLRNDDVTLLAVCL